MGVWYGAERWLIGQESPIPAQEQQTRSVRSVIKVGATFPVPTATEYGTGFDDELVATLPEDIEVLSEEADIDGDGDIDVLVRVAYDTWWLDTQFKTRTFDEDLQEYGKVPDEKYAAAVYAIFMRQGNEYVIKAVNESKADLDPLGTSFNSFIVYQPGWFSVTYTVGGMRCWNSYAAEVDFRSDQTLDDWFAVGKITTTGCPPEAYNSEEEVGGDDAVVTEEELPGDVPFSEYPFPG